MARKLGRKQPKNFKHVYRYPLSALVADPTHELIIPPPNTEKNLGAPWWWRSHDQGQEGACVGFGASAMMSITNHVQRLAKTGKSVTYRYDSKWLYQQSQLIDEWDETPPEEGTSVNAACKILNTVGHKRIQENVVGEVNLAHGIQAYRWATTVDEIRAAIYANLAVAIGVVWYTNFDELIFYNNELWVGRSLNLGQIRGGHCVCLFRMSDSREAFRFMNSWGEEYPPTWISYDVVQRLIDEYGEAVVIVDK